jgi:hypothetical protein
MCVCFLGAPTGFDVRVMRRLVCVHRLLAAAVGLEGVASLGGRVWWQPLAPGLLPQVLHSGYIVVPVWPLLFGRRQCTFLVALSARARAWVARKKTLARHRQFSSAKWLVQSPREF